MQLKIWIMVCLVIGLSFPFNSEALFIAKRKDLEKYQQQSDIVIIASTGRSGSSMLTKQIGRYMPAKKVLKTHLLPPNQPFKGKIIFIFSNPDQAAESALYTALHYKRFWQNHFKHVETADRQWWKNIGKAQNQTEQDNLLSYDALGTYQHLKVWLYTQTQPSAPETAQILAVKYENLWDEDTIQAIRSFLGLRHFELPPKRPRGHKKNVSSQELTFKQIYNLGTAEDPVYAAYSDAKVLWEQAPAFQYLRINSH